MAQREPWLEGTALSRDEYSRPNPPADIYFPGLWAWLVVQVCRLSHRREGVGKMTLVKGRKDIPSSAVMWWWPLSSSFLLLYIFWVVKDVLRGKWRGENFAKRSRKKPWCVLQSVLCIYGGCTAHIKNQTKEELAFLVDCGRMRFRFSPPPGWIYIALLNELSRQAYRDPCPIMLPLILKIFSFIL